MPPGSTGNKAKMPHCKLHRKKVEMQRHKKTHEKKKADPKF